MATTGNAPASSSLARYLLPLVLCSAAIGSVVLTLRGWFPTLASEHGAGLDRLNIYLLTSTGAILVIGHFLLAYLIFRFTNQGRVSFHHANSKREKFWLFAPMILIGLIAEGGVLVMGMPVWSQVYGQTDRSEATIVEVTGEQFGWNVRYPGPDGIFGKTDPYLIGPSNKIGIDTTDPTSHDDILLFNKIYLPVDRPAIIRLRSKDVIHDFFLPNFRVKQDLVPGLTIETRFKPLKTGEFELACAELCGLGHFQMRGTLVVADLPTFQEWLSSQKPFFKPST